MTKSSADINDDGHRWDFDSNIVSIFTGDFARYRDGLDLLSEFAMAQCGQTINSGFRLDDDTPSVTTVASREPSSRHIFSWRKLKHPSPPLPAMSSMVTRSTNMAW